MANNLEPRAKIGDVVIAKLVDSTRQIKIDSAALSYDGDPLHPHWNYYYRCYRYTQPINELIFDKDILKNLTTNISYEKDSN